MKTRKQYIVYNNKTLCKFLGINYRKFMMDKKNGVKNGPKSFFYKGRERYICEDIDKWKHTLGILEYLRGLK